MDIKNKIVIVTGAIKGVGATISTVLVNKGAIVYGLARNNNDLKMLQNELGQNLIPVPMYVSDQKPIYSWVKNT